MAKKTIDDYYALISTALADLQTLIDDCVSDTGYLPEIYFNSQTNIELLKDGTKKQKIEKAEYSFDSFKKEETIDKKSSDSIIDEKLLDSIIDVSKDIKKKV